MFYQLMQSALQRIPDDELKAHPLTQELLLHYPYTPHERLRESLLKTYGNQPNHPKARALVREWCIRDMDWEPTH